MTVPERLAFRRDDAHPVARDCLSFDARDCTGHQPRMAAAHGGVAAGQQNYAR